MPERVSILAWGHRRATGPIEALADAARRRLDIDLAIAVQPLAGFEHEAIAESARRHDLVVFDHPFCGDIAAAGCFADLAATGPGKALDDGDIVGPSLDSYRFGDALWGVPVDAACQHALVRADLLDRAGAEVPRSWDAAVGLGEALRRHGLAPAIALAAPHALLVLAGLCANLGRPWATAPGRPFDFDEAAMAEALDALERLAALGPAEAVGWNSIDLHDAMTDRDDLAYSPCVFGYATYGEADVARRLSFAGFAGLRAPFDRGAVIGGAGIGLSATAARPAAALEVLRLAADRGFQAADVPARHGQPADAAAWADPAADAAFNGFFSAVRPSLEASWVRPRVAGYPAFQQAAGALVTGYLAGQVDRRAMWDGLRRERDRVDARGGRR